MHQIKQKHISTVQSVLFEKKFKNLGQELKKNGFESLWVRRTPEDKSERLLGYKYNHGKNVFTTGLILSLFTFVYLNFD